MRSTPVVPSVPASLLMALAVLSGGCSLSTYTVQVDAISRSAPPAPGVQPQSYHIKSNNPNLDEDSLRYKEVAGYVKTALSGKGMYEAPPADHADMVIDLDFGMESPRVRFDTQVAPMVMLEHGDGVRYEIIPVYDPMGRQIGVRTVEVDGQPVREEMLQSEKSIRPVIVYEKFLKISARSNQEAVEGRPPPEVWSVNVSAEDESKELRKYLPILASATADYIGTNTKQEMPVKLKEDDEVVGFIRKGM